MHPVRKQRLLIVLGAVVLLGIAAALTAWALRDNLNAFYSPADVAAGKAPAERRIRVGGLVVTGSLVRAPESLQVEFALTDGNGTVPVAYEGILPDLFREGQGILATGRLNADGKFVAEEILAKHDENYMPPEVKAAMDEAMGEAMKKGGHPGAGAAASAPANALPAGESAP